MRLTVIRLTLWTACVIGAVSLQAQVSPWSSGTYSYDGAGNVKAIGSDYYVYDEAGRLVKGSADKQRSGGDSYQTYTYDPFGNRLTVQTTGTPCANGCGVPTTVDAFNHLTNHGATYDGAGNIQQLDNFTYTYDGEGVLSKTSVAAAGYDVQYIYDAAGERIAIYTGGGQWRFSVRDLDGKVIREVTASQSAGGTAWTWSRDHVFRDGLLLASVLPGTTRNYHLDHLGSPRLVTDENHHKIGVHSYYPFGDELSLGLQEPVAPDTLKFTGHERDEGLYGLSLDYMHARYYSSSIGRFLSVDPVMHEDRALHAPQMWNRYSYVMNNPLGHIDPDGRSEVDVVFKLIRFFYKEGKIIGFETTGTLTRAQAVAARELGKSVQVTAKTEKQALRIANEIEDAAYPESKNIIHGRDAHLNNGNQAHVQSDGEEGHTYYRTFAGQPLRSAAELVGGLLIPLKLDIAIQLARYGLGEMAEGVGRFIDDARQNNAIGGERRGEKAADEIIEKNQ